MGEFLQDNLITITVFYGLSFFVIFAAIAFQRGRTAHFDLADTFMYLAGFGLLHGIGDLVFLALHNLGWTPSQALIVKQIGRYFLAGSYVFLYLFGLSVFLDKATQKTKWIVLYSPIITMVFFVITLNPFDQIVRTEVIFRLFLGFPSAILASAAMLKMSGRFGALKLTKIVADFRGAAISFFFYAIFTGLFWVSYPKTILILGLVPVQLLRAITMIVLAYFTVRILGIFKLNDSN